MLPNNSHVVEANVGQLSDRDQAKLEKIRNLTNILRETDKNLTTCEEILTTYIERRLKVHSQNDAGPKLEGPPRTENFEKIYAMGSENESKVNSSEIMDDGNKPRDKRALGILLQGLAEALGYQTSPISLSTLPNPNTTAAGAAAAPPPVFVIQGGARPAPATPAPPAPPAQPARPPPRPVMKPNPPTPSPKPPTSTAAPRQRETLRFTGVVNFGNNSDLLGHLRQYEQIFHGSTTAAPANSSAPPASAAPPPQGPPQSGLGKPPLLSPFFVQIPLPIAPNLPPPLPPSAPRTLKQMEYLYTNHQDNENYERESQEISDEKDVQKDPPGDTYIDEPEWKKKEREQQEAEADKYRDDNYREDDESEENYDERDNSAESLKKEPAEEEDEESEENNKDNKYNGNEEERENSTEGNYANKDSSEEEERKPNDEYPKKEALREDDDDTSEGYESDDEKEDEESKRKSHPKTNDHTKIQNGFDSFTKPFEFFTQDVPTLPHQYGSRLPIRVFEDPFGGGGLRDSYGQSLEHEGKIDDSVADYFQRYKNPETGLFDSRKIQSLDGANKDHPWWYNYHGSLPGLEVERLEKLRKEYSPPADARYEEYNLEEEEEGRRSQQKSRKGGDAEEQEEEAVPQRQRDRTEFNAEDEEEEEEERIEPTLKAYTQINAPKQTERSRKTIEPEYPGITPHTPLRSPPKTRRANQREEQDGTVESKLATYTPTTPSVQRSRSAKQDAASEPKLPKPTRSGRRSQARRSNEQHRTEKSSSSAHPPNRVRSQGRRSSEQDQTVASRLASYGPTEHSNHAGKLNGGKETVLLRLETYKPTRPSIQGRRSIEQHGSARLKLTPYSPYEVPVQSKRHNQEDDQDETVEATITTYTKVIAPENVRGSREESEDNGEFGVKTYEPKRYQNTRSSEKPRATSSVRIKGSEKTRRSSKEDETDGREPKMTTILPKRRPSQARRSSGPKTNRSSATQSPTRGSKKWTRSSREDNRQQNPKASVHKSREIQTSRPNGDKKSEAYVTSYTRTKKTTEKKSGEGSSDNEKEEPNVTTYKPKRENVPLKNSSKESSKSRRLINSDDENEKPEEIRQFSDEGGEEDSKETSESVNTSATKNLADENDSAEDSKDVSKFQGLVNPRPSTFKGFDFIRYSPYFRPLQVKYEPEKLQRTADKILSFHNFEDPSNEDESQANQSNGNNEVKSSLDLVKKLTGKKFDNAGFFKYSPYFKPIQYVYDPEKLQRTADKILASHNFSGFASDSEDSKEEKTLNADSANEEKDHSPENVKADVRKPETITEDDRKSEAVREDNEETEKLKDDDGSLENVREDNRESENLRAEDDERENSAESLENVRNDERPSENFRNDDHSSGNVKGNDHSSESKEQYDRSSENIRENYHSSESKGQNDRSSENVGKNYYSSENEGQNDRSSENVGKNYHSSENEGQDDRSSENVRENINPDEETSQNLREAYRSSENLRDDDRPTENSGENRYRSSENLREDNNEENYDSSSYSQKQSKRRPDVGLPTRLTGKNLHEGENKEVQAWPAPFDHTFDSTESSKIVSLPNNDKPCNIRHENIEPTYGTPAILEYQDNAPDNYHTHTDNAPTHETPASEELRGSGYKNYPSELPTNETPTIENSPNSDASGNYRAEANAQNGGLYPKHQSESSPQNGNFNSKQESESNPQNGDLYLTQQSESHIQNGDLHPNPHSESNTQKGDLYQTHQSQSNTQYENSYPAYQTTDYDHLRTDRPTKYHPTYEVTTESEYYEAEPQYHLSSGSYSDSKNAAIPQPRHHESQEEIGTLEPQPENPAINLQSLYEPQEPRGFTKKVPQPSREESNYEVEKIYDGNYGDRIEQVSRSPPTAKVKKHEDPRTTGEFFGLRKKNYASKG